MGCGIVFDWAHCLVASGGVGLIAHNITLEMLDRFNTDVKTPGCSNNLSRNFFQTRAPTGKEGEGAHIKAYASECLTAICTLALFAKCVLGGPAPYVAIATRFWSCLKSHAYVHYKTTPCNMPRA